MSQPLQRKPAIKSTSSFRSQPVLPLRKQSGPNQQTRYERVNPFVLREHRNQRKRKPASNILHEMQKLQESTDPIIPVAPFQRVIR